MVYDNVNIQCCFVSLRIWGCTVAHLQLSSIINFLRLSISLSLISYGSQFHSLSFFNRTPLHTTKITHTHTHTHTHTQACYTHAHTCYAHTLTPNPHMYIHTHMHAHTHTHTNTHTSMHMHAHTHTHTHTQAHAHAHTTHIHTHTHTHTHTYCTCISRCDADDGVQILHTKSACCCVKATLCDTRWTQYAGVSHVLWNISNNII